MEEEMLAKTQDVLSTVKPDMMKAGGALAGMLAAWWTGLPVLAQALLAAQAADIATGLLCAITGRSKKTESGRVSSGTLFMGVCKKGLEWLVVGVCHLVGSALNMNGIAGAAISYMIATELVSFIENLTLFGLDVPVLRKVLEVAQKKNEL